MEHIRLIVYLFLASVACTAFALLIVYKIMKEEEQNLRVRPLRSATIGISTYFAVASKSIEGFALVAAIYIYLIYSFKREYASERLSEDLAHRYGVAFVAFTFGGILFMSSLFLYIHT